MNLARQILTGVASALAAAAVSSSAQTNLIVNGGFETGDFAGWTVCHWSVEHVTASSNFVHSGHFGAAVGWSSLGDQCLSQTVTTIPGVTYEINFWLKYDDHYWTDLGAPPTPNYFEVRWGGTVLLDAADLPAIGWVEYSLFATASSTTSHFSMDSVPFTLASFGFDDVSVKLVPSVGSISNVRASQHPGEALVDLFYDLDTAGFGSSVSVSVSSDGGASFTVPATHFTGDGVTSLATPGSDRHIVWDAGTDLGAGHFPNIVVRLSAGAAPVASGVFPVDLRGMPGELTVQGRVRDALTQALLNGVTVSLAGLSRTTPGDGSFSFALVSLPSANSLTVSKSGYLTHMESITVPPGAIGVVVPDIYLQPAGGTKPVVTGIRAKYDGIFLSGVSMLNQYSASVNWNGRTPSSVEFYVNGSLSRTVTTSGPEATAEIDMALGFYGSLTQGADKLRVVAVDNLGVRSEPFDQAVTVIPSPAVLDLYALPFELMPGNNPSYRFRVQVPPSTFPSTAVMVIPGFDSVEPSLVGIAELDYHLLGGEWEFRGGGRFGGPKLSWGNWKADIEFTAEARGVASQTRGFDVDQVGLKFRFDAMHPVLAVYVLDMVPGGQVFHVGDVLLLVGVDVNSIQRLQVNGLFRLDADLLWRYHGSRFQEATIIPGGGLQALYAPNLLGSSVQVDITGRLNFPWRINPPMAWKVSGEVSLGLYAELWGLVLADSRWILLSGEIASSGNWGPQQQVLLRTLGANGAPIVLQGVLLTVSSSCPRLMARDYLKNGPERFLAGDSIAKSATGGSGSALDNFRVMGQSPVKGSVMAGLAMPTKSGGQVFGPLSDGFGSGTNQADLRLVENVFPSSAPAMAANGQELMLLYVGDNGTANPLQSTDIRWTRFDGTNWSAPATIHTNTRAEFAPQVAYDGNRDAIAVWERVADANFNTPDLTAMAAQMEVVWSKWNHTSAQWSTPQPLSVNGYLDHAPLVCGALTNGAVLAVWTANLSNLLMGTNGAGSQVLWSQWSPVSQNWSAPQIFLADLPNRLSQSLSGVSNVAVYAWTRDSDGVLTNDTDQQVFYCAWTGSAWSAAQQFTTNSVGNRNARVAVSGPGSGNTVEGFESGGFSQPPWTFTGNAPWLVQSGIVSNGSFAAASGTVTDNQSSGMSAAFNCSTGVVSFAYRVGSESGYDFLRFYIDGQQKAAWSGNVGWAATNFPVATGLHTFEWRYTKDDVFSSGFDKAWVDNVVFPAPSWPGVYLLWQRGTNLVLSADFSSSPSLVRADSQTAGFADYAMTIGPAGNVALLWQEMSLAGSDVHYRVLDPASATWSKDALLLNDPPLERSFAPVWDDVGNLTVAYNKMQIIYTNKTVTLEGGGTVTITNVPQPGRVDLCVSKRALVRDLALAPGDFSASADNYLPGAAVALSATLRNSGDLAVSNTVVAFYDGNPAGGGLLITNTTVFGCLEGAATNTVSAVWVVPEPATNHLLYAVADPGGAIMEFDEANNTQSLNIGGTDLAVSLVSHSAETNGSVRVIAQVQNLGAPSATNTVLAIRRAGETNAPLATAHVPLLEPGRLAQVAVDLPAGTQPEGEAIYRLFTDETHVVPDVETNNNTTAFAVNLWLDADGDGIPDGYEAQYAFLNSTSPADATLDYDGDGLSNLAEYCAGTLPNDPNSYLRMTGIGADGTNSVAVAWGSASNRLYTLQRSSSLARAQPFTNLVEHILGTPPENVYMDVSATNAAALFYRIKVE